MHVGGMGGQKCDPLSRKCVENATPRVEKGVIDITELSQPLESEGAILNPLSLLLLDLALPVANKLVLTSDRVYLCACILLGDLFFCAPEGRIALIGASNRRRVLNRRRVSSSRNDDLIPKRLSYPESINLSNRKPVTVREWLDLHVF